MRQPTAQGVQSAERLVLPGSFDAVTEQQAFTFALIYIISD